MLRHLRLGMLVALFIAVTALAAGAAPFAYITNTGAGTVSVIDLATNTVATTIPVGILPFGVAMSPDGSRVYVSNLVSGTVSVISTASNSVIATITVGSNPFGLALNPAGTRLYVARSGNGSVGVYDTSTFTQVGSLITGVGVVPRGLAMSPDGSRLVVTTRFGVWFASVVDTSSNTVIATFDGGNGGTGVVVSPDSTHAYVAREAGYVAVLDLTANIEESGIFIGAVPMGVALNAAGTRLYVANSGGNSVSVVDTVAKTELMQIPVGASPQGVSLNAAGDRLYVVNRDSGNVSVVNTATNSVVDTIPVGMLPMSLGAFIHRPASVDTALELTVSPGSVLLGSAGPVTFSARLTRRDNGNGVSGATVAFAVDGNAAGSAVTGADGMAAFAFNPSALGVNAHSVTASFGGSTNGTIFNASTASGSFQVVYAFSGWFGPVNGGVNTKTAGQTVVVKWRLTDASGAVISALSAVSSVKFSLMACGGSPSTWQTANGTLSFDPTEGAYVYQWRTQKGWSGCARLAFAFDDGTTRNADFSFR